MQEMGFIESTHLINLFKPLAVLKRCIKSA